MVFTIRSITNNQFYRPDIDGLRAFAVLSVILYHFNETLVPGGYLGVDIFFVISGYVITNSISQNSSKKLSEFLLEFYARRVKRILPPLITCVVVGSILISLFSPTANDSLKSGLTALFGFSNLFFLETSADYFGSTPELNVFTHTWSLGVEEQFYFIYPILFWFIYKSDIAINNRFSLTSNVILILTLLSLIAYILLWPINPIAAFYLIFTRFWELGAGCLAYLSIEPAIKKISLYKYDNYYVSEILFIGLFILLSIPDKYIVFSTIASVL